MKNINSNMIDGHSAAKRIAEQKKEAQNKNQPQVPVSNPLIEDNTKVANSYNMPKQSLWEKTKSKARQAVLGTAISAQVAAPIAGGISSAQTMGKVAALAASIEMLQSCDETNVTQINDNAGVIAIIQQFMDMYAKGNAELLLKLGLLQTIIESNHMDMMEVVQNIEALLKQANIQNADLMNLVKELLAEVKAGNITADEMFNKILLELVKINKNLETLSEIRDAIKELDKNNTAGMDKIIEAYEKGNATLLETLNSMKEILTNIEGLSKEQLIAIEKIYEKVEQGGGSVEDNAKILGEILEVLKNIDSKLGTVLETLNTMIEQNDKNHKETTEKLDNIFNGIGDVGQKLDGLHESVKEGNETNKKVLAAVEGLGVKIDEVKEAIGKSNATLEDFFSYTKEHDKDADKVRLEMLEFIKKISSDLGISINNSITLEQLEELFAKYQTNLTTTNGLIQTLVSMVDEVIRLMGTSGNNVDLSEVIALLAKLNQSGEADSATIQALMNQILEKLDAALEKLGSIDGTLKDILKAAEAGNAAFEAASANAEKYAGRVLEYLDLSINMAKENAKKTDDFYAAQLKAQGDILLAIKGAVDSGVSNKDELIALFKDFPEVVQILKDMKSTQITIEQINQALADNKTNLTTTNGLIQSAINLLDAIARNTGNPAGSIDISELKSLLATVLTAINDGKELNAKDFADLKAEIAAMNKKLDDLGVKPSIASISNKSSEKTTNKELNDLMKNVKSTMAKIGQRLDINDNTLAQIKMAANESPDERNKAINAKNTYFWRG